MVLAHASVKELIFDEGDVTITGTLNGVEGKKLVFQNGARIVGTAATLNAVKIDCDDAEQCLGTGITVTNIKNAEVSAAWFGAKADSGVTNNLPIMQKAVSCFPQFKRGAIYIPGASLSYQFAGPWVVDKQVKIYGDGEATNLVFPGAGLGVHLAAQKSEINDVFIHGNYGSVSNGFNSATAHGLYMTAAKSQAARVTVRNFDGDGILVFGNSGNTPATNANLCKLEDVSAYGNGRAGIHVDGFDGNACKIYGFDVSANARGGAWDSSFLGCDWHGGHSASNVNDHNFNRSRVNYQSKTYWAIADSLNVAPGTDPTKWQEVAFGGSFRPEWDPAVQYYQGFVLLVDDPNATSTFTGCYSEGDEFGIFLNGRSFIIGGFLANYGRAKAAIGALNGVITMRGLNVLGDTPGRPGLIFTSAHNDADGQPFLGFTNNADQTFGWGFSPTGTMELSYAGLGDTAHRIWSPAEPQATVQAYFGIPVNHYGTDNKPNQNRGAMSFKDGIWLGVDGGYPFARVRFGTAAPTTGWNRYGEIIWYVGNSTTILGYRCIVQGDPGTWITITTGGEANELEEVATFAALPTTGAADTLYVITTGADANKVYRWAGTVYAQVGGGTAPQITVETSEISGSGVPGDAFGIEAVPAAKVTESAARQFVTAEQKALIGAPAGSVYVHSKTFLTTAQLAGDVDCTAALNTFINSVANDVHFYFDKGVYVWSSAVSSTGARANVTFEAHPGAIFKPAANFTQNNAFFFLQDFTSLLITGFHVRGNGDIAAPALADFNNGMNAFYVKNSNRVKVIDGHFTHQPKAAVMAENVNGLRIIRCDVPASYNYAFYVKGTAAFNTDILIQDCRVSGQGTAQHDATSLGMTPMVMVTLCKRVVIKDVWINDCKNTGTKTEGCSQVIWNNVHVDKFGKDGIKSQQFGTEAPAVSDIQIINCSSKNMQPWSTESGGHFLLSHVTNAVLDNLLIEGGNRGLFAGDAGRENGILIFGTTANKCENITIDNVVMNNVGWNGIYGDNAHHVTVGPNVHIRNYAKDTAAGEGVNGIYFTGTNPTGITINGAKVINATVPAAGSGSGIVIDGGAKNPRVIGCEIENPKEAAVKLNIIDSPMAEVCGNICRNIAQQVVDIKGSGTNKVVKVDRNITTGGGYCLLFVFGGPQINVLSLQNNEFEALVSFNPLFEFAGSATIGLFKNIGNSTTGDKLATYGARPTVEQIGTQQFKGVGTPLGVIKANAGATYQREDGAPGTTFYIKNAGEATTADWAPLT